MSLSGFKSIHAYVMLAQGRLEEKSGILIAESLNGLLIALVFILFSIGIARFFLPNYSFLKGYDLPWLKLDSFSSLKLILWEMLLTTMFIFFASRLIILGDRLDWPILITPVAILLLSVSYKFFKYGH